MLDPAGRALPLAISTYWVGIIPNATATNARRSVNQNSGATATIPPATRSAICSIVSMTGCSGDAAIRNP